MDAENLTKAVDAVMKKMYNLSLDRFQRIMQTVVDCSESECEDSFLRMRQDFFRWWVALSTDVKTAFVAAISK